MSVSVEGFLNPKAEELNDNEKFWNWIVNKLRTRFTNWDYTRAVDIPEYVVPKCLESLNENIEKIGPEIFRKRREKLRESLSNIGPGLLFDRTDRILLQARKDEEEQTDNSVMTISKYEEAIAEQSERTIESHETLRPVLYKIEDLNNHLTTGED